MLVVLNALSHFLTLVFDRYVACGHVGYLWRFERRFENFGNVGIAVVLTGQHYI